jgi:hypothetical protein
MASPLHEFRCACGEVVYWEHDVQDAFVGALWQTFRGKRIERCPGCGHDLSEEMRAHVEAEVDGWEPMWRDACFGPARTNAS